MTTEIKRDLTADLAICDAATSGPWVYVNGTFEDAITCNNGDNVFDIMGHYEDDAVFIAEARTGWPYAIRRALDAETELAEQAEVIAHQGSAILRRADRIAELEADIERLLAHCREVIDLIVPNESEYKCDYRREWALRVLDESDVVKIGV